jgi:hypothetical protein
VKKKSKVIMLVVLGIVLVTVLMSGCIKKDECYEPGVPEDTYGFEHGFVASKSDGSTPFFAIARAVDF